MYLIVGVVMILFGTGMILSRKEQPEMSGAKWLLPFCRLALFLYKRMVIRRIPIANQNRIDCDLEGLHPGESVSRMRTEYFVKKAGLALAVLFLGTLLSGIVRFQSGQTGQLQEAGMIKRGEYGEGVREVTLQARWGEQKQTFQLEVEERQLTEAELEGLAERLSEVMEMEIVGENLSLGQVDRDLDLIEEVEGFPFTITWRSQNPEILSSLGKINRETAYEGEIVLEAVLCYGEWQTIQEYPVYIMPSKERDLLEGSVLLSERNSRKEPYWTLPREWQGEQIVWKEKREDNSVLFWGIALSASCLIFFLFDKDLHSQLEEKKKLLKEDYPAVLHKIVLYLGAGMTVRGAFVKTAHALEQGGKKAQRHPIYNEMLFACREIQTGVSEVVAYERFGKRTGMQEYIRMSTLLTQNLKKGNSTLLARLREEAEKAAQENVNVSRQKGEEAGTKLLAPMILMLAVVMVMIMIPALTSFGT